MLLSVVMLLEFYKYQGTGNDFVLVDNRTRFFPKKNTELVAFLCNRRFGIGADGLILLENDPEADFKMVYYNSDGHTSSMCGNGGRCIVAFAKVLGIIDSSATFNAVDGLHTATIDEHESVHLRMQEVKMLKQKEGYSFLDTGSPHHVQMAEALSDMDIRKEGAKLRYGLYGKPGSNINFVEPEGEGTDTFRIRTYERGVEDETLSCGTGVTAAALAMHHRGATTSNSVDVKTRGGDLKVTFNQNGNAYTDVYLIGPATLVFKGSIQCPC